MSMQIWPNGYSSFWTNLDHSTVWADLIIILYQFTGWRWAWISSRKNNSCESFCNGNWHAVLLARSILHLDIRITADLCSYSSSWSSYISHSWWVYSFNVTPDRYRILCCDPLLCLWAGHRECCDINY